MGEKEGEAAIILLIGFYVWMFKRQPGALGGGLLGGGKQKRGMLQPGADPVRKMSITETHLTSRGRGRTLRLTSARAS